MEKPNIELTGDEARALMIALTMSDASLPSRMVIDLWARFHTISQVQPATPVRPMEPEDVVE